MGVNKAIREWYNEWVKNNAKGKVLDVGKSKHWSYGFPTIDSDPSMRPTFVGNVEDMDFEDDMFDVVLCNGMYEFVHNPRKMIDECLRVTKLGGKVIFGFVGKDYKPYRDNWKFYEGKESLIFNVKKDFGNEYHYLICRK